MNIKDFIVKGDIASAQEKTHKKTEYTFTLEYENDTDFILKRTTQKTEKYLVVLISQAQIYIKDAKQNTIEKVENISQIRAFKTGMTELPNFDKLIWKPFYKAWDYSPISVGSIFETIIAHLKAYQYLANKKLNPFVNMGLVYKYENDPENFGKISETVKMIHLFDEKFSSDDYRFDVIKRNLIDMNVTYNTIQQNLNTIKEFKDDEFLRCILSDTQLGSCVKDYLCDFKRLIEYFLYTIKYRNGLEIGLYNDFRIRDYVDYLRMQKEMYGKVKEKYPLYWLSEKQMMNKKYNNWKKLRELQAFSLEQEKMTPYIYEDDVFKVIVPMSSSDILDEAEQQQHCVASYINRIKNGDTHVLFIRTKEDDKTSLLTVEVTPDARIIQVRGFQNRDYTPLEYAFMKKWAKEKNLKLEVKEIV